MTDKTKLFHNLQDEPPLLPKIDSILVLDGDGNRLAGKYYNDFMSANLDSTPPSEQTQETRSRTAELRSVFERQIHAKTVGISARADAAEVISVAGRTAVFCGGRVGQGLVGANGEAASSEVGSGDVRVIMVGPSGESELVLAHFCEGMFEALSSLMGGTTDRTMILDNLELVMLLIDELCDGGIVLEIDPNKLVSSVVLRDDDGVENEGKPSGGPTMPQPELTMAQAFRQARDQFITGLGQRDGM